MFQLQSAGFNAGQVEQAVDQLRHVLAAAVYGFQRLLARRVGR